ncbi:fatty acid/phospholipid synthesis protein [Candidatus Terasakiella magnetica]|uniref:Phosphate acyltransferase n=1 Tax=Candidatus Terasakiella magnetica TaxID=1867952 RepID=A0A1C3RCY9_9PROT|nr:phosphate acyltransferase PlsX [Candidatus Terasakiella magnetica]SCA55133.1 fatty acid/phospholipid synthesis protein [Candidatus Terasakiella magnetica]
MSNDMTLAIDAMGGDAAPAMVVEGLSICKTKLPGVRYLLVGDERQLEPLLIQYPQVKDICTIVHTEEVVTNDDKPAVALRNRRNSSMRLAINAVKSGDADGIVSAGNTGALMAMAKFALRTLPGIDRPAIATYLPHRTGGSVMLDLGANVECDADNLTQFAVMGEVYARNVLGLEKPKVGLLNIGEEDLKGNDSVKQAHTILRDTPLDIDFYGFVEGDDIGKGTVDVIVTDGFTGNIALKTVEGTAQLLVHFLKDALTGSFLGKLGAFIAKPALMTFKKKMDPRQYNGAMFLGLNGICVKSHGGTDALGFANAVGVAHDLVHHGFNDLIKKDLERLMDAHSGEDS